MGVLFRLTFSNIQSSSTFSAIKIAVVKNDHYLNDQYFSHTISALERSSPEHENKSPLLAISYVSTSDAANALLKAKTVIGILEIKDHQPVLTYRSPGTKETILKKVIESINDKRAIYEQQLQALQPQINQQIKTKLQSSNKLDASELQSQINQMISQQIASKFQDLSQNTIKFNLLSSKKLDATVIGYYSLIAMACLSGAYISMFAISSVLANMSEHGKRLSVSPAKKPLLILSSLLSAFLSHLLLLTMIFLFNIFILQIDYGPNLSHIFLLSTLGSFTGISLGLAVGTLIKSTTEVKVNLITFFYLFYCFLAGMMGSSVKYFIDTKLSLLNHLNPANMIVDGLYSLNIYDNLTRYYFNLSSLFIFSIFCIAISVFILRKQKYQSL